MEERTLLLKLESFQSSFKGFAPVTNSVFISFLVSQNFSVQDPIIESLINVKSIQVSSHYDTRAQTLWIFPYLFFEAVTQVLNAKRNYKTEFAFWDKHFQGEDSVPWQRFARAFLKDFTSVYSPEEVKRILLLLRAQAEQQTPLILTFANFLQFAKTSSLASVHPAQLTKPRHVSTIKLQYAKLLFFTLSTHVKRAYFQLFKTKRNPNDSMASKKSVSVEAYRRYQEGKTLRNPAHLMELTEKLESLRILTDRRSAKPQVPAKVEIARTKVMVKTLDFIRKQTVRSDLTEAFGKIFQILMDRKATHRKGLKIILSILRGTAVHALQRRFHRWHISSLSGILQSRSKCLSVLPNWDTSRINKEESDPAMISRDCIVAGWFLGGQLCNSIEKLCVRRISAGFQSIKTGHLNKVLKFMGILQKFRKRILLKSVLAWGLMARQLHSASQYRNKCGKNVHQLQIYLSIMSQSSSLDKLAFVVKKMDLKTIMRGWNRWKTAKGKRRKTDAVSSPVAKAKTGLKYHTPSKKTRSPSPKKSPNSRSPAKSPKRLSGSRSNSPKPKRQKLTSEERVLAPKKKRDKTVSHASKLNLSYQVDNLKQSIVRIRTQHAVEKLTMVRRMIARKPSGLSLRSGFTRWRTSGIARARGKESPRFVKPEEYQVSGHYHTLSFSRDEGFSEEQDSISSGRNLTIAELRAAISTLRRNANAR